MKQDLQIILNGGVGLQGHLDIAKKYNLDIKYDKYICPDITTFKIRAELAKLYLNDKDIKKDLKQIFDKKATVQEIYDIAKKHNIKFIESDGLATNILNITLELTKLYVNEGDVRTSKGDIYESCPYVDRIEELLYNYTDIIQAEDLFEIVQKLETVRRINQALRTSTQYKFATIIKRIKELEPSISDKIDEIVLTYTN